MKELLKTDGKEYFFLEPNAKDEPLRKEFQKLRYGHFKKEPRNEFGLERDSYDEVSAYIVCVEAKKIIGGCRLIPGDKVILPIARSRGIVINPDSIEISRLVAEDHQVKCMMYVLIYKHCVAGEIKYAYALARKGLTKIIKKDAVNVFQVVGEEISYNGLKLVPIMAQIERIQMLTPAGLRPY